MKLPTTTLHSQALLSLLPLLLGVAAMQELTVDFYQHSCPHVESVLREVMVSKMREAPTTPGATLRLFFHDCFVEGCDASVLITSTPGNEAEMNAEINLSLAGDALDAVHRAKAAVERACPGVVSCADVLAIITRDLVHLSGGPSWEVTKGRRDGLVSRADRVGDNLPAGNATVDEMTRLFISKGLTQIDLIALSGAHTLGFAHCSEFMHRIYNFNQTHAPDPTMNSSYAGSLRKACPLAHRNPDVVASFDAITPFRFDNGYYKTLQRGLGLLTSDQELLSNVKTSIVVDAFAKNQELFFEVFTSSMSKLGNIGVKNQTLGVIRKECHRL